MFKGSRVYVSMRSFRRCSAINEFKFKFDRTFDTTWWVQKLLLPWSEAGLLPFKIIFSWPPVEFRVQSSVFFGFVYYEFAVLWLYLSVHGAPIITTDQSLFFTPEPWDPGEPICRRSLGLFPAICVGSVSGAAAASKAVSPPRTCSNSCFVFDFVIILSFKFHFGLFQEPEANRSFQDILCHLRALVVSRTPHRYLRFKHKLVLFWKC